MSRLIQPLNHLPSNNLQLICFPFAGGYSASFRPLYQFLKESCNFYVAEPPGHGTSPLQLEEDFEELVDMYLSAMIPILNKPFVLFGHSMGGLIVYRLAQRLEQLDYFPERLIISGVQPPHIGRKKVSHMDDDNFLDYVINIGGIPAELVKAREVLNYFLPPLKADFKALESFEHLNQTRIKAPVHIFNGEQDAPCMAVKVGWEKWVNVSRYHTFNGGHMFLQSETGKVAQSIEGIFNVLTEKESVFS